uniref:Uncharacterized protein n=1 Tax=Avena sativa TaxID=4498 RepID=A0ACD5U254_AVESA
MAALLTPAASSLSKLMAQGRESAAALEALLRGATPQDQEHGEVRELAAEILRCCDRALAALHGGGRKRGPGDAAAQTRPSKRTRASGGGGETAAAKRVEKKWTVEDGFIWRKYGQKEILHSKHPRLYFRCTYKDDSGCRATRQVQLSEDDPSLYVITYFGEHTCCHGDNAVLDCEDAKMQPFVINFGSAAAAAATSGGGSPPWLSSCSDDGDGQSETSRSSQAAGSPEEEDMEELGDKVTKIEPASSDHPSAAELSSSPDASCCSPPWDPLAACSDWDIFNEASFDYVISDYFEL